MASPEFPTLKSRSVPANTKAPSKKPAPSTKPLWQKLFIKGGTVLLGALAKSFGLQPVSLVAIDDTWSALRVKRT